MGRKIIAHAHIFKNAGTTIDSILENNFGGAFHEDVADRRMASSPDYLKNLVGNNLNLQAFSSHALPLPIVDMPGVEFYVMLMLRHPILRVRSVYEFEKRQNAQTPGAIHAKRLSFRDYTEWRMHGEVSPTIRDMQVRYLTRNEFVYNEKVCEEQLQAAQNWVDANRLVGLVEQFDNSMVIFSEFLKSQKIYLDFSYVRKNASIDSHSALSDQAKLEQIELALGSSLYQQLLNNNQFDLSLYNFAQKIISERFDKLETEMSKGLAPVKKVSELILAK